MTRLCHRAAVLLFMLFPAVSLMAQTIPPQEAAEQYNEAGRLYQRGAYDQSYAMYQQLIQKGIDNPDLYFNASNAAYRCRDLGHAVLYIERSLKLAPGDQDALVNRAFLNSIKEDKESTEQNAFFAWTAQKYENITADGASKASLYSFGIAFLLFSAALYFMKWKRVLLYVMGGIACVCFLVCTGVAVQKMNNSDIVNAIIMADEIPSYSGPGAENTHLFTLHEGTKVTIDRKQGDWCLIRLRSGEGGWIQAKGLEAI
jgi:tetratricopeptide (TPR) repeat protein